MNVFPNFSYKKLHTLRNLFKRFPVSFCSSLFSFIFFSFAVFTRKSLIGEIGISSLFGYITCAFAQVLYEQKFQSKFKFLHKLLYDAFFSLISLSSFFLIHFYHPSPISARILVGIVGISISELIFIFYFSEVESASKTFSYFIKGLIFGASSCAIFGIGLIICLVAFNYLVFQGKMENMSECIYVIGLFAFFLYQIMCLNMIPRKNQKLKIPRAFEIISLNVLLPVYLSLLLILYYYLGQILILRSFPSNRVNLFVSISSLLYMFLLFSLSYRKNENKLINLFSKFGGLLIIPTIIMQFVSVYIRVSEYGLTSLRYLSVVFDVFSLIFVVINFILKDKGLKISLVTLGVLSIFVTCEPLNLFDIPLIEQKNRLKTLLINNNALVNGNIVKKNKDEINIDERGKIIESYLYIKNNIGKSRVKCSFLTNEMLSEDDLKNIFGFNMNEHNLPSGYRYVSIQYNSPVDISGYNTVYGLSQGQVYIENNRVICEINGKKRTIDGFYDVLKNFYFNHKVNHSSDEKIEYENDKYKFIITNGSISSNSGERFNLNIWYGYLLEK